jgi:hypothetical protein
MTAARAVPEEPVELELVDTEPRRTGGRLPQVSVPVWMRPESAAFVWAGIVVAMLGFVLIGIAWSQVAGETQVYLQLPYLVSAGLSGLGLIMVGVTMVNVAAKRRDAVERDRQIDQLVSILEELKGAMTPTDRSGRRR